MKIDGIRHITDKNELNSIFRDFFVDHDVMMKIQGLNVKVNVVKFEEGRIFMHIPDQQYKSQPSAIYSRSRDQIYYSHIIPCGDEGDIFIFEPEGVQVFNAARKEERKKTGDSSNGKAVISRIISNSVIEDSFKSNRSRIEWIRSEITGKLESRFENIRVFFLNDKKGDSRMKWIMQDRKPVFIPDINTKQDGSDSAEFERYLNDVYYLDSTIKERKYNSEIIVPLFYKGMMPFGYIQVNQKGVMPEEALTYIKRMGLAFSESISKDGLLFKPSEDSMMIVDLSLSGLGIFFKERSLIRHFREDDYILFTVFMPDNKQAVMLCKVMNINFINSYYKTGCMIENIDPIGDANYQEFIGML